MSPIGHEMARWGAGNSCRCLLTRSVNPCYLQAERNWGRVINIASVSAFGSYGQTNYAAAKAGLLGFTRSLAMEVARRNVTVNAISPGFISTEMVDLVGSCHG